jgi:hypothetical protein
MVTARASALAAPRFLSRRVTRVRIVSSQLWFSTAWWNDRTTTLNYRSAWCWTGADVCLVGDSLRLKP